AEQDGNSKLRGLEWFSADRIPNTCGEDHEIAARFPTMHDQGLLHGIRDPVVRDLTGMEHLKLVDEIALRVRRRQQLAGPVGARPHGATGWKLRHPLTTPPDHVVQVDFMRLVLHLDLGTEPPTTRPSTTRLTLKEAFQRRSERELRNPVFRRRTCLLDNDATDDLCSHVVR